MNAVASLDPSATYVHLAADGQATSVAGGDAFWSLPPGDIDQRFGHGWLIVEYECSRDWPTWEMHPQGDEFVYLLSGAAEMVLEIDGQHQLIVLQSRGAVVVPRGVWHTARVHAPSRLLFATLGAGTQHRPVSSQR
jgi:mannose-6-phosphate isomerase-like protein (cupin superfamily)